MVNFENGLDGLDSNNKLSEKVKTETKEKLSNLKSDYEITQESKTNLESLYKGTKYNNLDVNSAIGAIKKGLLDGNSNEFRIFLRKVKDYKNYTTSQLSDDGGKVDKTKETAFKNYINTQKFYVFGVTNIGSEVSDLNTFFKEQLGDDYDNILNGKKINEPKKQELVEKYENVDVMDSKKVDNLDINNIDSLLGYISDFGGTDQGEKPDGILRAKNSKSYTGFLNRIFTNGEWSQSKIVGELQVYNKLKDRIKNLDSLKKLIAETVYPNGDGQENDGKKVVDKIFEMKDTNQIQELLRKFQSIVLGRVVQTRNLEAVAYSNNKYNNVIVEQARDKINEITKVKNAFEQNPNYKQKINELTGKGVDNDDAKKILNNWTFEMLSKPELYVGLNITTINNETINKVVDNLGKTLSETKTEKVTIKGVPYLILGLNIASFKDRLGKDGIITAEGGLSATGALGLDGIALPLSAGTKLGATIIERNDGIQDGKLKGNWKIIGGASIGKDLLQNGNIVTMASVDLDWNDKIDSIEKHIFKNKILLSNLIDNKGNFASDGINKTKIAINNIRGLMGKEASFDQTLYLNVLETNLVHLENIMKQVDSGNEKDKDNIKKTILNTWIKSVVSDYEMNLKNANSGVNLSGLHIGYIFGINLLNIGLNFQHIQAAYKISSDEQKTKDYEGQKKSNKDLSIEIGKIDDGKPSITIPKKIKVEISKESANNISIEKDKITGDTILNSKDKTNIYIAQTKEHDSDTYRSYSVVASNNKGETTSSGNLGITEEGFEYNKLGNDVFDTLGLKLNVDDFKNRIYRGVRGAKDYDKKDFESMYKKIDAFLNNPNEITSTDFKNHINKYTKLFQGKDNITKIENFDITKLQVLLSNMRKFTWGDYNAQKNGGEYIIIPSNSNKLKEYNRIFKAEKNVFNDKIKDSGVINERDKLIPKVIEDIVGAKEDILKNPGNYNRKSLLDPKDKNNYAESLSMVVSTPKGGNPSLTTIPDVDTKIYGDPKEIKNDLAKEFILKHFEPYIEANLVKINKSLNNYIKGVELKPDDYKKLILGTKNTVDIPASDGTIVTFDLSISKFQSFVVGFEGNECTNAGAGLLLGKTSFTYHKHGEKPVTMTEITSDIGSPKNNMDSATVGFSVMTNKHTDVTEKVEQKPKPNEEEGSETVEPESSNTVEEESSNTVEEESSNTVEPESSNTVEPESSNTVEPESSETVEPESSNTVEDESSTTGTVPENGTENGTEIPPQGINE